MAAFSDDALSRHHVRAGGAPVFAANSVADLYAKQFALLEHDLVGLVRAMPAERYDFRPSEGAFAGVRTFGEQVRHVATMLYMTAAIVLRERSPFGPGTNDNGPDTVRTKEQALEYLGGAIAYAKKAIAALDERTQFEQVTTVFGAQSRSEVVAGLTYHSYNHYGQMVVYARMTGVVPPSSRP
jgi:DinB superfamily